MINLFSEPPPMAILDKKPKISTKQKPKKYQKIPKPSKIDNILKDLNVDDTFTKKINYRFDKVHENTFPMNGYNQMADLLLLPTTKEGYKYLLTIIDIWSNFCDFEPMKTKTANETLEALKTIYKRNYITKAKASIQTDNDGAFQENFNKWLKENHIAHPLSEAYRHQQMANVENLNRILGKLIMTYLSDKSVKMKEDYKEWLSIIPTLRKEINKMKNHPKDQNPYTYPMGEINVETMNKYNIGDIVYRPLPKPSNGEFGEKFRSGDLRYDVIPRKIINFYLYNNNWRYRLEGFPSTAYAESELKPSDENQEKYEVREIFDKKTEKGKIYYRVWWKRYKKAESTWEPKTTLLEDGLQEYIDEYEANVKKTKKK